MDSHKILDTTIDVVGPFSQQLKYSEPDLLQALTEWNNIVQFAELNRIVTNGYNSGCIYFRILFLEISTVCGYGEFWLNYA